MYCKRSGTSVEESRVPEISRARRVAPWARGASRHAWLATFAAAFVLVAGCGGGGGGSAPPPPPPSPPSITQQPQNVTVNAGQQATFAVVATGATTYQWMRNGQNISGATSASYTLNPATSTNNGDTYQVAVSNAGGTVNSATATLRVTGVAVIAGQPGGMGFQDGPAAQARFWGPVALAFDSAGNLFVADYNTVREIDTGGNVTTVVGSPRTCGSSPGAGAAASLCFPYSLATDSIGNVYAGDNDGVVWKISAGVASVESAAFVCPFGLATLGSALLVSDECASTVTQIQAGTSSLYANVGPMPMGLSADGAGTLFVASDAIVQSVTAGSPATVATLAGMAGTPGTANGSGSAARFGCATYPYALSIGIEARFNGAFGIATTSAGLSYVSDYCNNTVRTVDAAGNVSAFAGTPGSIGVANGQGTAAQFWAPAGVALDAAGNVYVADYGNALIRKITPAGNVSTYAGSTPHFGSTDGNGAAASFRYPRGITADANGNLYVTDSNHTIRKITPAGVVSTLAGTAGVAGAADGTGAAAQFFLPKGIVADSAGNLYVADSGNYTVRKVTPAGVVTTFAGLAGAQGSVNGQGSAARFESPNALAIDAAGTVFVSDQGAVRAITPTAQVITVPSSVSLNTIQGIAVNASGTTVYFTTRTEIASLSAGTYTYIAGTALTGSTDGTGAAATFNNPRGIVLAGDGNLYVADQQNSTIRKVTLAGVVSTPIGTAAIPMGAVPGGLPARLGAPWGLALLSSGPSVSLAITDEWESVILRADLP